MLCTLGRRQRKRASWPSACARNSSNMMVFSPINMISQNDLQGTVFFHEPETTVRSVHPWWRHSCKKFWHRNQVRRDILLSNLNLEIKPAIREELPCGCISGQQADEHAPFFVLNTDKTILTCLLPLESCCSVTRARRTWKRLCVRILILRISSNSASYARIRWVYENNKTNYLSTVFGCVLATTATGITHAWQADIYKQWSEEEGMLRNRMPCLLDHQWAGTIRRLYIRNREWPSRLKSHWTRAIERRTMSSNTYSNAKLILGCLRGRWLVGVGFEAKISQDVNFGFAELRATPHQRSLECGTQADAQSSGIEICLGDTRLETRATTVCACVCVCVCKTKPRAFFRLVKIKPRAAREETAGVVTKLIHSALNTLEVSRCSWLSSNFTPSRSGLVRACTWFKQTSLASVGVRVQELIIRRIQEYEAFDGDCIVLIRVGILQFRVEWCCSCLNLRRLSWLLLYCFT